MTKAMPIVTIIADAAVEAMEGRNACLLANHGLIAVGADLQQALRMKNIDRNPMVQ